MYKLPIMLTLNQGNWFTNTSIIKDVLKRAGVPEEIISNIKKIGISTQKNIKYTENENVGPVKILDSVLNKKVMDQIKEENINIFSEPLSKIKNIQQNTNNNHYLNPLLNVITDKYGWFIYSKDVEEAKTIIRNVTGDISIIKRAIDVGIDNDGRIKIMSIEKINLPRYFTKKQNVRIIEKIKNDKIINENMNLLGRLNFYSYLYPKTGNIIKELSKNLQTPHNNTAINIAEQKISLYIDYETFEFDLFNDETIIKNEGKTKEQLDTWLKQFINDTSQKISAICKEKTINVIKLKALEANIIQILKDITQEVAEKHFNNQKIELRFINNAIKPHQPSSINLSVNSKGITFAGSITFSKPKITSLLKKIEFENAEEEYYNLRAYISQALNEKIKENVKSIIDKYIENQKAFYPIEETNIEQLIPDKIKEHMQGYIAIEKRIPRWLNYKPDNYIKAQLYAPDKITFTTKFFTEGILDTDKLIETEYGQTLQKIYEAPLKNDIDTAKSLQKNIKKLKIEEYRITKPTTNNKVKITFYEKKNEKTYIKEFIQNIADPAQNQENNNKIIEIINDVKEKQAEAEKLIEELSNNIINVAIAEIISNNEGLTKNAIATNLRGSGNARYQKFISGSSFDNKLNLFKKEELEEAVEKLANHEAIKSHNKSGKYGTFTVYYPNSITKELCSYYKNNKDEILKKNNIILKSYIKPLIEIINESKAETLKAQDFLPLLDDKITIIDYSMNLEVLKEIFKFAPDEIIKLMTMKKKLITNDEQIKVYDTLIKIQKKYNKLLKKLPKEHLKQTFNKQ